MCEPFIKNGYIVCETNGCESVTHTKINDPACWGTLQSC